MNITLTPELEKAVAEKIKSGEYANESELVCKLLEQNLLEPGYEEWIQTELHKGIDDLDAGRFHPVHSEEQFLQLARSGK